MSGRSKYSMLIRPRVVEAVELGEDGGEVDHAVGVVGMELGLTLRGLAQLHVIGMAQQADRILAPRRHVTGVDREAQPRDRLDERLDLLDALGDAAGPGLQPRASAAARSIATASSKRSSPRRSYSGMVVQPDRASTRADAITDRQRQRGDRVGVEPVDVVGRGVEWSNPSLRAAHASCTSTEPRVTATRPMERLSAIAIDPSLLPHVWMPRGVGGVHLAAVGDLLHLAVHRPDEHRVRLVLVGTARLHLPAVDDAGVGRRLRTDPRASPASGGSS